jgi:hypothetical protein
MDDAVVRVRDLLHEAAEVHHTVYRIVDGDDPDWASWYSDWLINLSELPEILGRKPVRSELTALLVRLGREQAGSDDPWEEAYAGAIVREFLAR